MTIRKKYVTALLAAISVCAHAGAQSIRGAVFGGGQNAVVMGNTTVVVDKNSVAADDTTTSGASGEITIVFDGTDGVIWNPYLDASSSYDYNKYGSLYDVNGDPLNLTYVDGDGKNCLKPYGLPHAVYKIGVNGKIVKDVNVYGMQVYKEVSGNSKEAWADYLEKGTDIYDYKTYGIIYVKGEPYKDESAYLDASGNNILDRKGLIYSTTYQVLSDVLCVAGGGENGNVTGNSTVEIHGGVFGHADDVLKRNSGQIVGGGLYGTVGTKVDVAAEQQYPAVMPEEYRNAYDNMKGKTFYPNYTEVVVDGNSVDMYGDVFGGGYGGDVLGSAFVRAEKGFLCNVFGGGVQADVLGRTHMTLGSKKIEVTSVHVSRFNKNNYKDSRVDDQADVRAVESEDNLYGGPSVPAYGSNTLIVCGSAYGGGAYGQVGTSLTEADVKEMAAATITMNSGYVGYTPGMAPHHMRYEGNSIVKLLFKNPYTLYQSKYMEDQGDIHGGGYGASTTVPNTKINFNSGFVTGSVLGGGEKGDIGLVRVPYSYFADKGVDMNDSTTLDAYRMCKGMMGDIIEIPKGTAPTQTDGNIYYKKIFADTFDDGSKVSDIIMKGNSQYMVRHNDERVDKNYHVTRVDGTVITEKSQGLTVSPVDTSQPGNVALANPTDRDCGFIPELRGSYYIYDDFVKDYVLVYDKDDGWEKNLFYGGKYYDAERFALKGRNGAADITLKPEDYYNLVSILCVVGGGYEGDAFGSTNINMEGGSYGAVVEAEKEFYGEVVGGSFEGFVNGNTNISIGGYTDIYGSVYGGGIDGNVDGNTNVYISGGYIGSVYGGGMYGSVGWYLHKNDEKHGNTFVTLEPDGKQDPHTKSYDRIFIAKNVYGGSAFGIVRTDSHVKVTGGRIGYFPDYDTHSYLTINSTGESDYYTSGKVVENINSWGDGNVFGAGYGNISTVIDNTYVDIVSADENHSIYITGSVYGGGRQGSVGMGFVRVPDVVDQRSFDVIRNFKNNASPGNLYKFVNGQYYKRGNNGYIPVPSYVPNIDYYMAVKHVGDNHGLETWADEYGNTNVYIAANDGQSSKDGKVYIGGAVIGGSRGYNTIFEGNRKYTEVESMYIGFVLNDTHVKVGSGSEKSEKSIEVHGNDYYIPYKEAKDLTSLTPQDEYVNFYFQKDEHSFYAIFQDRLVDNANYYAKSGDSYALVETPNATSLANREYFMQDFYGDYIHINPDTTTTANMAAAIKAMTKEGGCMEETPLYVVETIYSVVGGGEDGSVIGDTFVDVTNGTMGYQKEDEHRRLGDVVGGGLNGHVMGYTRLNVDGQFVYIMGECYGGGYNGIVRNTTKTVADVMATGILDPDDPKEKDPLATELLFQRGMARDIFGGSCYTDILRGNSHLQIGKQVDGKSEADHYVVISQSAYGGSCYANVEGESVVDMYNGIVGYSRARPIIYYDPALDGEGNDPNHLNDELNKETWLTKDNNGNDTDNYLGENYWWWADFREGNVFGAGYGADSRSMKTTVNIYGGRIRNSVYGGGEMGDVNGNLNGKASERSDEHKFSEGQFADRNEAGADLSAGQYSFYKKDGDTYTKDAEGSYYRPIVSTVNIYGGLVGDCIFGGGMGVADSISADVFGSTMVNIKGGEWIARSNRDDIATDPYLCNTFGGGRVKATIYGDTFLNMEKTMCGKGIVSSNAESAWRKLYTKWYSSKFCVYGAGYGSETCVYGNTNVLMNVKGIVDMVEVDKNSSAHKIAPYKCQSIIDLVGGGYEGHVDGSTFVTVDGNSFVRNVYGGGFFAKVGTKVSETEYPTTTNVTLKAGAFESIYGGGFLSDVHGETNVDYGVYGAANDHLFTRFNLYGGTNVSGNIAGSNIVDFGSHINIYGGTIGNEQGYSHVIRGDLRREYNVKKLYYIVNEPGEINEDNYRPVVDDKGNYDSSLFDQTITTVTTANGLESDTVYTIKNINADGTPADIVLFERMKVGNVYGAGNGDYPGFYEDGLLYQETGHSYLGQHRPNVASTKINIVGTKGHPAVINGAVFGGGNASTVGFVNPRIFSEHPTEDYDLDYQLMFPDFMFSRNPNNVGSVHINVGGYAKIKNLFLGSNGECLINNIYSHVYKVVKRNKTDGTVTPFKSFSGFVNQNSFRDYMEITAMSCVPKLTFNKPGENGKGVFEDAQDDEHNNKATDITIGSFFVGGNVGSMVSSNLFEYTLPEGVTITDKVVGGSNNANFNYTQFYSPYPEGTPHQGPPPAVTIAPQGWTFIGYEGGLNGGVKEGPFVTNKVKLNLLCKFEPTYKEDIDANGDKYSSFSGCMVYGGCYESGSIFGNVDIYCNGDMLGSHSAYKLAGTDDFFPAIKNLITSSKDFSQQFATIFGGGYGEDTKVTGSTNIVVQADEPNDRYPVVNRIFGGGDRGVVQGNTKITFDAGVYGAAYGNVYGGGFYGVTGGNTELYLHSGSLVGGVYAGARMADVLGSSYVKLEDNERIGSAILESLYGGCDISGEVKGMKEYETHDGEKVTVNSFISVSEMKDKAGGDTGFPFVGHLYGGSDGHYAEVSNGKYTDDFTNDLYGNTLKLKGLAAPMSGKTYLDITGGTIGNVYAGGNNVTVDGEATINYDMRSDVKAVFRHGFLRDIFLYMIQNHVNLYTGYKDVDQTIIMDYQVANMFGGNNVAPMYIQPKWKLKKGSIGNLYSGGNRGAMHYYKPNEKLLDDAADISGTPGIELTIESDDISVDKVYGGCRMADVKPYVIRKADVNESDFGFVFDEGNLMVKENGMLRQCVDSVYDNTKQYYIRDIDNIPVYEDDKYGSVLNVISGKFEHVYGGNDVAGTIYNGTNVNISGAISGNVYGAGNGNYLYQCDPTATQITGVDHPDDPDLPELYFRIPCTEEDMASDVKKIAAVNAIRPNVSKSYLNVEGKNGKIAYVKGNLFCGGNSSTILSNRITGVAKSLFNIGSNVTVNGVYLGSDGQSLVDGTIINNFKKINKINTLSTALTSQEVSTYGLNYYKNPTLLTLYMKAVETRALPQGFELADHLEHANIGTFCCGGNRGSVAAQDAIDITFPSNINIFKRIIGGCNNANFTYDGVMHEGGFVAPNFDKTTDKIHFTVNSHFLPKVMDVENGRVEDDYLVDDINDGVYNEVCNVYGGCFLSGYVYGKVKIDMHSNLLENVDLDILDKTNKKEIPAFSVFGGGYGAASWNIGGVNINMNYDETVKNSLKTDASIKAVPVVNNFFGGGQQGNIIGNTTLNITAGEVYNEVCGGSLAGYLYGSTQILVGYPQYYICNETKEYKIKRGDSSEDNLQLKNETLARDKTGQFTRVESMVLRQKARYVKGDIVPANVYQMIIDADASQAANFTFVDNPHDTWTDNDKIWLRKGVYGGGYAHVNGFNVYAGSYTVCSYTDEYNLTALNNGSGATGEGDVPGGANAIEKNVTYGGNTCVLVSDDRSPDSEKDHITISSEKHREVNLKPGDDQLGYYTYDPNVTQNSDNKYIHMPTGQPDPAKKYYTFEGEGGIFGDGRMVFAEGLRAVDIYNYGYASYTPQFPKLMNTLQRCDIVSITDCCMQIQGAQDFATNSVDATVYSITRVNELRLNSTIDAQNNNLEKHEGNNDVLDKKKTRNYLGLFHNIHYLGSLISNSSFDDTWHNDKGIIDTDGKSYREYKKKYIDDYVSVKDNPDGDNNAYEEFKKRNIGTAKNLIGINNGYCLKIQNCYTTVDDGNHVIDHIYYGPVEGVVEVRLLTLIPGEGGGYIYADNVHDKDNPTFLNVSGNFVFPGMAHTVGIAPQHIVDDCFPTGYYNTKGVDAKNEDVHYWFVEGNLYFYSSTITGYTYTPPTGEKELNFDMNNVDQIITLSGTTPNPNKVVLKSVRWQSEHDTSEGYSCDLEDFTNKTGYEILMSVSDNNVYEPEHVTDGSICYLKGVPRETKQHSYDLTLDKITDASGYVTEFKNIDKITNYSPLLAIRLRDTQRNGGRDYYHKHMEEPDYIQLVLQSEVQDPDYPDDKTKTLVYTYVVNLTIKYVLGPMVTGTLHVKNCALPGEIINVSKSEVVVDADESMPVTNSYWKLLPKVAEGKWTDVQGGQFVDQFVNPTSGDLELPARYIYDGAKVEYFIETSNYVFPIEAPDGNNIVVHNYHRMQKVASLDKDGNIEPQLSVCPGSRIYIKDKTDLERFRMYLDYCNGKQTTHTVYAADDNNITREYIVNPDNCEGLKFFIQDNLIADGWTVPTTAFKGEINGDGYVIDLSNTTASSLLNANDGQIYNLGVVGTKMANTNSGLIMNSFSYGADVATSNSGMVANSYQNFKPTGGVGIYASTEQFNEGEVAYNLNKYYLDKRYVLKGSDDTPGDAYVKSVDKDGNVEWNLKNDEDHAAYQYIYDYYRNGDYRYAKVHDGQDAHNEYLRTEDIPNYDNGDGKLSTFHLTTHDPDPRRARYQSGTGDAATLTAEAAGNTYVLNEPLYPEDYIFFGQKLVYGTSKSHNNYPVHIDTSTDVDNRVYRASGFYGSKQDQGVHFNHAAAFNNASLTAIDLTCQRDKETATKYVKGYRDAGDAFKAEQDVFYAPTADYDGITAFSLTNSEITRNLLVYTPKDESSKEYTLVDKTAHNASGSSLVIKYDQSTAENNILAHHMTIETEGTTATKAKAKAVRGLFHLVDKQDFNSPIAFDVDTRAWYERKPECLNEGHNDGWESICLPFTVKKVTATQVDRNIADGVNSFNHGEITHFFGTETDKANYDTENPTDAAKYNTDHNQVGHEYWLRGFTDYADATNTLTFMRPTAQNGGGFYDKRIIDNEFNYVYDNRYLAGITDDKNGYSYYDISHTYNGYMPLTADVPYIISYPGTYFYEFNMTGEKMTYENPTVTIGVTDDGNQSSDFNGYEYFGTFSRLTPTAEKPLYFSGALAKKTYAGDCFMLSDVNQTDADGNALGTIYPFRGFFKAAKASGAKQYLPFAGTRLADNQPSQPVEEEIGGLRIWVEKRTLCIDSPKDMMLNLYTVDGIFQRRLDVKEGSNRFDMETAGVYIVHGKKYFIR